MKIVLATCLLMLSSLGYSAQESILNQQAANQVSTQQLKTWYEQNIPMTIVDARSQENFDGKMLPRAFRLPFNASNEAIDAALPSKGALIVVYCCGRECPASCQLTEKLHKMGYTQVYEYHAGIQEWLQKGYPIDQQ